MDAITPVSTFNLQHFSANKNKKKPMAICEQNS